MTKIYKNLRHDISKALSNRVQNRRLIKKYQLPRASLESHVHEVVSDYNAYKLIMKEHCRPQTA